MKKKFILLSLIVAASTFGAEPSVVADPNAACCKDPATLKKKAGGETVPTGAFSKNSIYQAEAGFTSDSGRAFSLGALRGRPVVFSMFFSSCSSACPLIVSDMQAIRAKLPAAMRFRAAFVLVSFDVARDTPAALANYRIERGLDEPWVLLHGSNDSVRELAAILGVKYKQDADGSFSHSNLITILNSQGEIVHQRIGLHGGLDEAAAALAAAIPTP